MEQDELVERLLAAERVGEVSRIAALTLREVTVRTHLENVYRRLGVRSRAELAMILNAMELRTSPSEEEIQ